MRVSGIWPKPTLATLEGCRAIIERMIERHGLEAIRKLVPRALTEGERRNIALLMMYCDKRMRLKPFARWLAKTNGELPQEKRIGPRGGSTSPASIRQQLKRLGRDPDYRAWIDSIHEATSTATDMIDVLNSGDRKVKKRKKNKK